MQTTHFHSTPLLQPSPVWSRAITLGIIAITTFVGIGAAVCNIEEAIPATGKLEPQSAVKEIQTPVAGVVKTIYVKDGQRVKKGDRLLALDTTTAQAQLTALQKVHTALLQENEFYRLQLNGAVSAREVSQQVIDLNLPAELVALTRNRAALIAENQLYHAQLQGSTEGLDPGQQLRVQSGLAESNSRLIAASLETEQLHKQFQQNQIKLASSQELLQVNQTIANKLQKGFEVGAISQMQFLKQQQDVESRQAEIDQLIQENQRVQLAIEQSQAKQQNTVAISNQDLLSKIADNDKHIADMESQLMKAIVENKKRLAEIDSQLSQAEQSLKYQEIKAPADGTIFELKAHSPGFVANPSEPIVKIVPEDALVAKITITNKDIGFIKSGMDADIRIDAFPFSEFGDVKGKLDWVGSDALPPDQMQPFYKFPAKVHLHRQSISVQGRSVSLQSGMSVSVNLKLRKRKILSIFTDSFMQQLEGLKFMR